MTSLRSYLFSLSMLAATLLVPQILRAQGDDSPLDPIDQYPRIGGEVGLSSVWQSGSFTARCGVFEEGSQIDPIIAAAYDYPFSNRFRDSRFRFEALLGYQGRSVTGSYTSRENVVLETANGPARANVDFENVGNARFGYLFFLPSVKFYITRGLYAGAGVNAGLRLGSSTQYTKNILSRSVTVPDFGPAEVYYPEEESSDPYSKVFESEDRPDASSISLDAAAYIGAEFPIGRKMKIGPRILYTIPFTSVFSNPELKLNTLQFLIGVRINLD